MAKKVRLKSPKCPTRNRWKSEKGHVQSARDCGRFRYSAGDLEALFAPIGVQRQSFFTMVEENFELWYPEKRKNERIQVIVLWTSFTMVEKKNQILISWNPPEWKKSEDISVLFLHHGWSKFRISIAWYPPTWKKSGDTSANFVHYGWRKFWISMSQNP